MICGRARGNPMADAPDPRPLFPETGFNVAAAAAQAKVKFASIGKMAFIGVLMLLLLIPVAMIRDLITEREERGAAAAREVSDKWGGSQQVVGPILTVPYRVIELDDEGKVVNSIAYAHFLPDAMAVKSALDPEIRHRGIYDVTLFRASLEVVGRFAQPDFDAWRVPADLILWDDAYVSLAVPDVRALTAAVPLDWNGIRADCVPDNRLGSPVVGGLHVPVHVQAASSAQEGYVFKLSMRLNGSGVMNFLPMGKETTVRVSSPWSGPSFVGAFLPQASQIGDEGFTADWHTLHLSRSFPQSWRNAEVGSADWDRFAFGVELRLPVDRYQKTMRCAKYAILFIVLTFLVFFMNEAFDRRRIHPLQYVLVGCALCLFYLLLLAFTEHIPFGAAYGIASAGVVALITAYGVAVLSTRRRAYALGGMLTALYGYLYTLLQMEDFALLMGSLGLFAILSGVMYLTRRINLVAASTAQPLEPA
jgi:inner membrane protein